MTLEDIIKQCLEDSENWFPNTAEDLGFLTIAMCGEIGEFANLIKKGMRGDFDIEDEQYIRNLSIELIDIFIYLCNIAGVMNLDLGKMYQIKREINNERFGTHSTNGDIQ